MKLGGPYYLFIIAAAVPFYCAVATRYDQLSPQSAAQYFMLAVMCLSFILKELLAEGLKKGIAVTRSNIRVAIFRGECLKRANRSIGVMMAIKGIGRFRNVVCPSRRR